MKRAPDNAPTRIRNQYGRFAQIPQALVRDPDVTDRAIRVYALLWTYSDDRDRQAYPSRGEMAEQLQVSVKTIDRGISELVERGALAVEPDFMGARQTSNIYTILTLKNGPEVIHRGVKSDAPPASNLTPPGGTNLTHQEQEPEEQENKSVPQVTTGAAVDNSAAASGGDGPGINPQPNPSTLKALRGRELDAAQVFASVGHYLVDTYLDDEGLLVLTAEILARAGATVLNPTAYVVQALRTDRAENDGEWHRRAAEISWQRLTATARGGR